ncbi:type IV pilus modification PilV family protein [Novipirellula sp. SH528]|uniref:type IV pilus modification PilV family protein n=1 Tax=Novipirellula sp. SH528 TaxID=3454466 RepID=UPI003FA139E6
MSTHRNKKSRRHGISLIEVIACTALVAILFVPIAGVIRASARTIASAQSGGSTAAGLQNTLAWVSGMIDDGTVVSANASSLTLQRRDGTIVKIARSSNQLVMSDGKSTDVVLAENILDFAVRSIVQPKPSSRWVGLEIDLVGLDTSGNRKVLETATVVFPPQIPEPKKAGK